MLKMILLLCALLTMNGVASAHEGHVHHHEKGAAQMAKLHKMMPEYASSQESIKAALETGDAATVQKETSFLLTTIPDLKKSKPHHGLNDLRRFKSIAASFRKDIRLTAELAGKGDIKGAKASFSDAQKLCSECHSKFRD